MRLFGGILPFIGFRDEPVDDDMRSFFDLPEDQQTISTFQVEWFNCGFSLVCGRPCPKTDDSN